MSYLVSFPSRMPPKSSGEYFVVLTTGVKAVMLYQKNVRARGIWTSPLGIVMNDKILLYYQESEVPTYQPQID